MAPHLGRRQFLKAAGGGGLFLLGGGLSLLQPRPARAAELKQADAISRISDVASASAIASYNWANRGKAPAGYIKGMAVSYAKVYYDLGTENANAVEMAKAMTADASKDALKHYEEIFQQAGMDNTKAGVDTLRHLFVLMLGLGMRESSGKYCEGRDRSANNTTAETAEAGLFQTSFNARRASPLLPKLFKDFMANPTPSYLDIFKEGVRCKEANWKISATGDGRDFQKLSKECPFFAAGVRRHRPAEYPKALGPDQPPRRRDQARRGHDVQGSAEAGRSGQARPAPLSPPQAEVPHIPRCSPRAMVCGWQRGGKWF